ncbi:Chloride channel protein CLC-c [Morus notabilis]|uniref:Chloride channel protein CLC-c n=1 Tax=Morus notabilis TaxID=981085 RepID=W9RA74_9ROSA|nr:Chloride channel protein CLC-c [Morus notabilis]
MTVSLCVILLELTNDLLLLPLVMLVLLISKTVADNFNHGGYDQIVKIKGFAIHGGQCRALHEAFGCRGRISLGSELSGKETLQKGFAKAGSGKGLKLEEEMEMYVDLHPITNTSPYTVVETMSLAKAAILFRLLGLRHMCVVPKSQGRHPIVGILTRHDFMPEHVLGLYPHLNPHK